MLFSVATVSGVLLAAAVHAQQNHMVTVGNNQQLAFDPPSTTANVGDTVTFMFMSKNHSVAQSTFAAPCNLMQGGFSAEYFPVQAGSTQFPTVTISVNTASAIWFYCPQTNPANHCVAGMVGAINPPPDKTFEQFQAIAKGQAPPPAASGSDSGTTGSTAPGSVGAPGSTAGSPPPAGNTPPPAGNTPPASTPLLPPTSGSTSSAGVSSPSAPAGTGAAPSQLKGASTAVVIGVLGVVAALL